MVLNRSEGETRELLAQYAETVASMLRRIGSESDPSAELEQIGRASVDYCAGCCPA